MRAILLLFSAIFIFSGFVEAWSPVITVEKGLLGTFEDEIPVIVQNVSPSVVTVQAKINNLADTDKGEGIWPFKRSMNSSKIVWNVGSGVVLDRMGHILTTEKVVEGVGEIKVVSSSGQEFNADFIGADHESRIAVLKIKPGMLKSIPIGDSDRLKIGQWVIALGNSLGISSSVSFGLISGKRIGRGMIQVTMETSPGNSGAPVFDRSGKMIGMVVGVLSSHVPPQMVFGSRSVSAVTLAVPVNRAVWVAEKLIQKKEVSYGWLGVKIPQSTEQQDNGLLVADVIQGSPADKAGIRKGDYILKYNGKPVDDLHKLLDWVTTTPIGKIVKLQVKRGNNKLEVKVKIERRISDFSGQTYPQSSRDR